MPANDAALRPFWHPDAKWVVALILLVLWFGTTVTYGAYRASAEEVVVPGLAHALDGLLRAEGVLDDETVALAQAQVTDPAAEIRPLPYLDVTLTGTQMQEFTPGELTLYVFRQLTHALYHEGLPGLERLILDEELAGIVPFLEPSLLLVTAAGHAALRGTALLLAGASLVLMALLVYFSYGGGRLISPGVVLGLATAPAFAFSVTATTFFGEEEAFAGAGAPPGEEVPLGFTLQLIAAPEVMEPLLEALAGHYGLVMLLAVLLILAGLVGPRLLRGRRRPPEVGEAAAGELAEVAAAGGGDGEAP